VDRLTRPRRISFVAAVSLAIVLAVTGPSRAAGVSGHGFGGGLSGGAPEHSGFEGHHFDGHHFDGHHFDGHHFDGRFGFGPVFPYYGYYQAPGYWYYCPSYGAYYPSVTSCPETWVPVPAS
jgi:hypothetical protein